MPKPLYIIETEFQTSLFVQRKTYYLDNPNDVRTFVGACAVAGVRVTSQSVNHILTAAEVADDVARERNISATLAGNALATAINPKLLEG